MLSVLGCGQCTMIRLPELHILLTGASLRLSIAAIIIAALWAGFVWATSTPGGS